MIVSKYIETTGGPTICASSKDLLVWNGIRKERDQSPSDYDLACSNDDELWVMNRTCGGLYMIMGQEPFPSMFWTMADGKRCGICRSYAEEPFVFNNAAVEVSQQISMCDVRVSISEGPVVLFDSASIGKKINFNSLPNLDLPWPIRRATGWHYSHNIYGNEVLVEFFPE